MRVEPNLLEAFSTALLELYQPTDIETLEAKLARVLYQLMGNEFARSKLRDNVFLALVMNRNSTGFMVAMIRPQMLQAVENAKFLSELERENRALNSQVDEPGRATVLFNAEGKILFRNRPACLCMERWFESREVSREVLPQTLRRWVSAQLSYPNGLKLNNFGAVWTLEKEERSLSVRLTLGNNPGEYILLLDEKEKLNPASLKTRFGLTTREAEVLLWVAQAKRNGEIATILGISERTVLKHMERILAKLGVENRTAAANMACEFLS